MEFLSNSLKIFIFGGTIHAWNVIIVIEVSHNFPLYTSGLSVCGAALWCPSASCILGFLMQAFWETCWEVPDIGTDGTATHWYHCEKIL